VRLFSGDDANNHNLLQEGRPFISDFVNNQFAGDNLCGMSEQQRKQWVLGRIEAFPATVGPPRPRPNSPYERWNQGPDSSIFPTDLGAGKSAIVVSEHGDDSGSLVFWSIATESDSGICVLCNPSLRVNDHEPVETDSTKQHVSTFLCNELLARETEPITVRARLIPQDYANSALSVIDA
jgi:hypothetical protein